VNGSSVLVVGVAYKRDIDDIRESPSLDVMGLLHKKGARVSYADPYVPMLTARSWSGAADLRSAALTPAVLSGADCVVILTGHQSVDYELIRERAPLVVDTRNAISGRHPHVFKLGAPAPRIDPSAEKAVA
jgi:UDP-N-acetyl-D-glucosamine dehydrogenase